MNRPWKGVYKGRSAELEQYAISNSTANIYNGREKWIKAWRLHNYILQYLHSDKTGLFSAASSLSLIKLRTSPVIFESRLGPISAVVLSVSACHIGRWGGWGSKVAGRASRQPSRDGLGGGFLLILPQSYRVQSLPRCFKLIGLWGLNYWPLGEVIVSKALWDPPF